MLRFLTFQNKKLFHEKSLKLEAQKRSHDTDSFLFCFTDEQKKSVKGITKHAQARLTHDVFKSVLMGDHGLIRTPNYRIGSINHQLYTIETNKIALTAFCDKRYYIDSIHSLPFGHKAIRENAVYQEIALDEEWGLTDIEEQIEEGDQSNPNATFELSDGTIVQQGEQPFFTPPDPGFYQQISYTESELEGDLVNFDEESATNISSDNSEERNPFIIHEAIEESGVESEFEQQIESSRSKSRKKRMKSTEQSTSKGEETPIQQNYKHSRKRRRIYLIESDSD